jgi:uncharacterized protein
VSLPARSVQSYFQILKDALLGFTPPPYAKSPRARMKLRPKFYLFDTGVVNALSNSLLTSLSPERHGTFYEHFIVLETYRYLQYWGEDTRLFFWQTHHGAEVDLLIEQGNTLVAAVEIKNTRHVRPAVLRGLRSFKEAHLKVPAFVVTRGTARANLGFATAMGWQEYRNELRALLVPRPVSFFNKRNNFRGTRLANASQINS